MLLFSVPVVFLAVGLCTVFGGEDTFTLAKEGIYADTMSAQGLFLYEETVVSAEESGTFYPGLAVGSAVSAGEICGEFHRLNDLFGEPVTVMTSPCAGIFSSAVDGLEGILTEASLGSLDLPAVFRDYERGKEKTSYFRTKQAPCFKVTEQKKDLSLLLALGDHRPDGEELRFILAGETFSAEILSRRYFGNDLYAVVRVAPRDICFASRDVTVEVICEEYHGILVDTAALREKHGAVGVYRSEDGCLEFCPVEVLCGDEERSVVRGIDDGDPILLGKS